MSSSASSGSRDGLLLAAAFGSGAAALAYEMLWTRMLELSLGSEVVGILAAVAGYFAGLALGAALLHDRALRGPDPVRLFVALELAAAAFALVSPHLLHLLARVLPAWLGPLSAAGGTPALAASTAVAALVLALGAAPLGASLAALVEARRRGCPEDQDGRGLGRVYAANTAGAALAALAAVHLIFPALGYALGAALAALVGALTALAAHRWAAGRPSAAPSRDTADSQPSTHTTGSRDSAGSPPSAHPVDIPPAARANASAPARAVDVSRDPDPDLLREPWLLDLVSFGAGAAGIGLQVVGVRVLGQHLENTVFTFAHILAAYLIATSAGALVYQRLAARAVAGRPGTVTAGLLWLLALLVVAAAFVLAQAPELLAALAPDGAGLGAAALAELVVAFLVFAPGALVMGALLSHVIGLVAAAGRGIGRTYACNALGCALAPFLFGLWAIPSLGYTDALYLVLYTYLAVFAVFGWFRRFSPLVLVGAVLLGVALTAAGPRALALVEADSGWVRIAEHETLHGLVAVSEVPLRDQPPPLAPGAFPEPGKHFPLRRLQVGKKFRMGGASGFGEQRMGQLCALLAHTSGPQGPIQKAMYLGIGTGSTMGGALQIPHTAAEAVELIPEILERLPLFADINFELAGRPKGAPGQRIEGGFAALPVPPGVTLHAADARRHLAAARDHYDLIVADLFHPGQAGASALFAAEHFAAARDHLRPGGLMCQWLPLYQLDEDDARTIVRTFLDAFPETYALLGHYNAHTPALALVGRAADPATPRLQLDVPRLVADTAGRTGARPSEFLDPRDLLAAYLLGPAELAAWAGEGPRNSDLRPEIAFRAGRSTYRDDPGLGARNLAALLPRAVSAPAELLAGDGAGALAAAAAPFTAAARHYLAGEIGRAELKDLSAMSWETAEHYVRAYEADPDFPPARGALYGIGAKNPALAGRLFPRMLARTPDEPRVYAAFLQHLQRTGDTASYQQLRAEASARFPQLRLP